MTIISAVATGIFGGALYPLALVARVCGGPGIALLMRRFVEDATESLAESVRPAQAGSDDGSAGPSSTEPIVVPPALPQR